MLNNKKVEKLKPCPFCGSDNLELHVFDYDHRSSIVCNNCRIYVSIANDINLISNKNRVQIWTKNAVKVWNTRKYTKE